MKGKTQEQAKSTAQSCNRTNDKLKYKILKFVSQGEKSYCKQGKMKAN